MTGQFAEVVLVENEGLVSFGFTLGIIRTEINIDLTSLFEDLVNPFAGSVNVLVGGGGVVVGKIEEGLGVTSELVNSLDGAERRK